MGLTLTIFSLQSFSNCLNFFVNSNCDFPIAARIFPLARKEKIYLNNMDIKEIFELSERREIRATGKVAVAMLIGEIALANFDGEIR